MNDKLIAIRRSHWLLNLFLIALSPSFLFSDEIKPRTVSVSVSLVLNTNRLHRFEPLEAMVIIENPSTNPPVTILDSWQSYLLYRPVATEASAWRTVTHEKGYYCPPAPTTLSLNPGQKIRLFSQTIWSDNPESLLNRPGRYQLRAGYGTKLPPSAIQEIEILSPSSQAEADLLESTKLPYLFGSYGQSLLPRKTARQKCRYFLMKHPNSEYADLINTALGLQQIDDPDTDFNPVMLKNLRLISQRGDLMGNRAKYQLANLFSEKRQMAKARPLWLELAGQNQHPAFQMLAQEQVR